MGPSFNSGCDMIVYIPGTCRYVVLVQYLQVPNFFRYTYRVYTAITRMYGTSTAVDLQYLIVQVARVWRPKFIL